MKIIALNSAGKCELHASWVSGQPIVARIWRGQTPKSLTNAYREYLYKNGVLKIERVDGNLGVTMFQSDKNDCTEFTVISYWPNRAAIEVWSGVDLTKTRHLERDHEFLLALQDRVELVDVYANDWNNANIAAV